MFTNAIEITDSPINRFIKKTANIQVGRWRWMDKQNKTDKQTGRQMEVGEQTIHWIHHWMKRRTDINRHKIMSFFFFCFFFSCISTGYGDIRQCHKPNYPSSFVPPIRTRSCPVPDTELKVAVCACKRDWGRWSRTVVVCAVGSQAEVAGHRPCSLTSSLCTLH